MSEISKAQQKKSEELRDSLAKDFDEEEAKEFASSHKGMKWYDDFMILMLDLRDTFNDDKDKKGLEDEWYAKILFVHPPRDNGPTAKDGISQVAWKENKNMSGELLSKVKRNNKIMIEFKGTATISRTD